MKLIFLDIDGVMTAEAPAHTPDVSSKLYPFAKESVAALNKILENNQTKIILTSSWRTVFDVEKQCQIFRENGVIQVPAGATTDLGYENRAQEINHYLDKHQVTSFVILDDMEISGFEDNFVKINAQEGLTHRQVAVINYLLQKT